MQLSYRAYDAQVARRASGMERRSRILVQAHNSLDVLATLFATLRVESTYLALSPRLTAAESQRYTAALPPRADDSWVGMFTSGTTGTPKLVELTQRNLEAAAAANAANLGEDSDQRWLLNLPLFHIGAVALAYRCARYGASLVLHERFDACATIASLEGGVTHASFVSTTLRRVLEARGGIAFRGVRAVLMGGGPTPVDLLRRARATGLPALRTYGLTEATSQVATERPGEADGETCGQPLASVQVRVVDDERRRLPAGVAGEIEVAGPTVVAPGWFATRDIGALDARGRLEVFARRSDVIVRGGEKVYPAEVEMVLAEHPSVSDVAVAPIPHPEFGQVPIAFIVRRDAAPKSDLAAWLLERLAAYKAPVRWMEVAELPRNAMGKVDRRALLRLVEPE